MSRFSSAVALVFALGLFGCAHEPVSRSLAPPSFAHETSDLKPEPAVIWGRLETGFRYAILPHATPRDRVSVYLLVQVGAFHERPGELGYAHFVEHLAFRDSREFPGDAATQTLQRLGLASGAHVNATTGLFETDYWFNDLPSDEPEALATVLKLCRSIADGIVFIPADVEQERGVIFSEARSRRGALVHLRDAEIEYMPPQETMPSVPELGALFSGSRIAERSAIGDEAVLTRATAAKLRSFYERWYRPDRAILVIAGDVPPATVEPLVRANFGGFVSRGSRPAPPSVPQAAKLRGDNVPLYLTPLEHEPAMHVTIEAGRTREGNDTLSARRRALTQRLALAMLGSRIEELGDKADTPLISTETLLSHYVPGRELAQLRATARPTDWDQAIRLLHHELRRAVEFGFTPAELQRAAKDLRLAVRSSARQAPNRPASQLAGALAYAIARDVVFTALDQERDLAEAWLTEITLADCHAALKEIFPAGLPAIALAGPLAESGEPDRALAAIRASVDASLTAYAEPAAEAPFPYTSFGTPGRIATRESSPALGAELIRFENGVRLNLRRTAFEPGYAHVLVRFGAGRLTNPPDQPGIDLGIFGWAFGGLRDVSPNGLRAAMSDISGGGTLSANAEDLRIGFAGETTSLPLMLQTAAAFFVYPAFREDDWPRALEAARHKIAPYESTADGVARAALLDRLSGHHPAHRIPRLADVSQRTLAELKSWLEPQLASAPVEITLVGDFQTDDAVAMVAASFGALPARATADPYAAQRRMAVQTAPFREELPFEGKQSVAVVSLAWSASDITTYAERLRGNILAEILGDRVRLKLRNELGETYSPTTVFYWNDAFVPSPTHLECRIETAPERLERVAAIVREIVATLMRDGVTPGEFERARRPLVRELETGLRNNAWWLDALADAQSQPQRALGWAGALAEYRAATREEINALARRLLVDARLGQLFVKPKPEK